MEQLKFSNRFLYPKLKVYEGLCGKIEVASPLVYLGIEVEAEQVSNRYVQSSIPGSWNVTEDGSLKDYGAEYVTVPIRFSYIEMELRRLFGAIPLASFSSRTSIHVHVNSRDFTDEELLKFLILYLMYERNLYEFSGDRWLNNFCIPLHSNTDFVTRVLYKCKQEEPITGIEWCKYHGLNLLPLMGEPGSSQRYGTIEFRHMIGNNNVEYIMDWCNLILRLKLAAKSMSKEYIVESLRDFTNKGNTFTHEVFGKWSPLLRLDAYIPQSKLKESVLGAKIICYNSGLLK